jgi:F0F1-type ATP synthase membrane subunit b/b'
MHIDSHTIKTLAFQFANLIIFVSIIYRFAKAPFLEFVKNRSLTLREQITEAKAKLQSAQEQYQEYRARLESMGAEVAALRSQNTQDVAAVTARIREDAAKQSQRIVAEARVAREASLEAAKGRLVGELGNLVLSRAEALIQERLTGDQRARIRREFSNQLEQIQ